MFLVITHYYHIFSKNTSFGDCGDFVLQNRVQKRVFQEKLTPLQSFWGVPGRLERILLTCQIDAKNGG